MKRWLSLFLAWFPTFFISMAAAQISPRAPAADLTVESIAAGSTCVNGRPCTFYAIVRNQGTAAYRGPISLTDNVPALTLLAGPLPSPWTCVKKGRGQFDCHYPNVTLEPGRKLSVAIALKVIGTTFGKMEHCGTITWNDAAPASRFQMVRERLRQLGYPVRDQQTLVKAVRDVKTKIGLDQNDVIDAELAASLLGSWGEGDSFAGNDRGCTPFELLEELKKPLERCRTGEGLVGANCVALATYCPGGQSFDARSASCKCPSDHPVWSSQAGQCAKAGTADACKPGQSMAKGECLCPPEVPVWSVRDLRCMAIDAAQVAAAPSKTDLAPSCTGGRILNPSGTNCICPQGLQESASGCVRRAELSPPSRPVIQRQIVKREQVRRVPDCPGARVWNSVLDRCVRLTASEPRCREGQFRRNGRCVWPKRAQARRPVVRKARSVRIARRCDGLTRWSTTMRHCIPFWIMIP